MMYAQPFSYLSKVDIDGYVTLHYQKEGSELLNKKLGSFGEDFQQIVKTSIDVNSQSKYIISFSAGPSGDPTFLIERMDGNTLTEIGYIYCLDLYIPGNGFLYSSGHTNNMFNTRTKWKIERGGLKEVPQPFYYVGLETRTLQPYTLYADEQLREQIAVLPADYDITVLLNKGELYLIKTAFGLTGWVKPKSVSQTDQPEYGGSGIEGLYYAGD
jgi:hypothetical protein